MLPSVNLSFRERVLWLAGLIEGEGAPSLHKIRPSPGPAVILSLGMTDRDVIERAHAWLGATQSIRIRLRKSRIGKKPSYEFALSTQLAVSWMMMLYPFLGERRRNQIKGILTAWRHAKPATGRRICINGHPYAPGAKRPTQRLACAVCYDLHKQRERIRYKHSANDEAYLARHRRYSQEYRARNHDAVKAALRAYRARKKAVQLQA